MDGVTLEQCEAALQTFYSARSEEQRVQAEAFLEQLRAADTNLDLAFQLMSNSSSSVEASFFGANAIFAKISTIPTENLAQLMPRMLQAASALSGPVLEKTFQIIGSAGSRLPGAYSSLLTSGALAELPTDRVLRLLRTMAETKPDDAAETQRCLEIVVQIGQWILVPGASAPSLPLQAPAPGVNLRNSALRCLGAWVPHGVTLNQLYSLPLGAVLVAMLDEVSLGADAAEVLIAAIVNGKAAGERMVAPATAALATALSPFAAATECLHHDDEDADEDAALAIVRLAAEVACEAPSSGIAGVLSDALAHPQLLVAEAAVPFWDWLAEQPQEAASAELWQCAASSVLLRSALEEGLDEDELFELDQFRRNSGAVILGYAVDIIGAPMVCQMAQQAALRKKPAMVEVSLFGLTSVAGSTMQLAAEETNDVGAAILTVFGTLGPLMGERHAMAVARFIGAFGWLLASLQVEQNQHHVQLLENALEMLAAVLTMGGEASEAAAGAVLVLSRTCKAVLASCPASLAKFVQGKRPPDALQLVCLSVVDAGCSTTLWNLPEAASREQLMEALARLCTANRDSGEQLLQGLLAPLSAELVRLQQSSTPPTATQLVPSMDILAAMVRGCPPVGRTAEGEQPQHIAVNLLGSLWPLLLGLVDRTPADEGLAQSFERLVSVLIRSTGMAFLPLLPVTMNSLSLLLSNVTTISHAVRAISSAVTVYGGISSMASDFSQVFSSVATSVFGELQRDRHQPQVAACLFELAMAYLVCAGTVLPSHPLFAPLMSVACGCLSLPEAQPVAVVMQVLSWLALKIRTGTPELSAALTSALPVAELVQALMQGLASTFPIELVPRTADILGPLLVPFRAELSSCMAQALSAHACDGTELLQALASCQDPCPRTNQQNGGVEVALLREALVNVANKCRH